MANSLREATEVADEEVAKIYDAWAVEMLGEEASGVSPERINQLVDEGYLDPDETSGMKVEQSKWKPDLWSFAILMGSIVAATRPERLPTVRQWSIQRWSDEIDSLIDRRMATAVHREPVEPSRIEVYGEVVGGEAAPPTPPAPAGATATQQTGQGMMIPEPPPYLTSEEREQWIQARIRGGEYIRGLGNQVADDARTIIREAWKGPEIVEEVDRERRLQLREMVREETAQAVAESASPDELARRLRRASEWWGRDWERVAQTELQAAHNEGALVEMVREEGPDAGVARVPNPDACDDCKRLYLDEAGRPRIFTARELVGNGTNVGAKRVDWVPTLWPAHPNCISPGSLIETNAGLVPIEEIEPGMKVLTHRMRYRKVVERHDNQTTERILSISIDSSQPLPLHITASHEIHTGEGWVSAESLRVGDTVHYMESGQFASGHSFKRSDHRKVVGIGDPRVDSNHSVPVHNLTVEEDESFVANHIVVHNCRCSTEPVPAGFAFNDRWQLVPNEEAG